MWEAFLQALGFLALVLGGAVAWMCWRWKRGVTRWHHYGLAASIHRFPGRLRLRRLDSFQWRKGDRAARRAAALQEAGFAELGGFAIDELPDARMLALVHPGLRLMALVHEQDELGTWTDVVAFREGEAQPVWASSILKRAHLHLLPGDPKLHHPHVAEADLVRAVRQARDPAGPAGWWIPSGADEFREWFEEIFARSVDARLLAPLEDYELRRLVRERGQACGCAAGGDGGGETAGPDEAEFAGLKAMLPEAINNELRLVCAAQFLRETTLPASEWREARERLAVIHDRTPLHELAGRLIYGAWWTPSLRKRLARTRLQRGNPRDLFARVNAVLPPWERYKKIGEVTRPVPADIYRAPLDETRSR